jgi:hypothetical protein
VIPSLYPQTIRFEEKAGLQQEIIDVLSETPNTPAMLIFRLNPERKTGCRDEVRQDYA